LFSINEEVPTLFKKKKKKKKNKCAQRLTLLETLIAEQEGKSEEREVVFEMVRACMAAEDHSALKRTGVV
jgi:hypothetical protein